MKIQNFKSGFSLIEVIFAVIFLTAVVFGVLKLQTSNLVFTQTQKNELRANLYAFQALEIAQALGPEGFQDCESGCALSQNEDSYQIKKGSLEKLEDGLFERELLTSENSLKNAVLLKAQVSWADGSGEHMVESKQIIH